MGGVAREAQTAVRGGGRRNLGVPNEMIGCTSHPFALRSMSKVMQFRDVPDEVHDALAQAARAQGLSLTKYVLRELEPSSWSRGGPTGHPHPSLAAQRASTGQLLAHRRARRPHPEQGCAPDARLRTRDKVMPLRDKVINQIPGCGPGIWCITLSYVAPRPVGCRRPVQAFTRRSEGALRGRSRCVWTALPVLRPSGAPG